MIVCDFCGKTEEEVKTMIMGDNGAGICNECVLLCMEILIKGTRTEYKEIQFKEENDNTDKELTYGEIFELFIKHNKEYEGQITDYRPAGAYRLIIYLKGGGYKYVTYIPEKNVFEWK